MPTICNDIYNQVIRNYGPDTTSASAALGIIETAGHNYLTEIGLVGNGYRGPEGMLLRPIADTANDSARARLYGLMRGLGIDIDGMPSPFDPNFDMWRAEQTFGAVMNPEESKIDYEKFMAVQRVMGSFLTSDGRMTDLFDPSFQLELTEGSLQIHDPTLPIVVRATEAPVRALATYEADYERMAEALTEVGERLRGGGISRNDGIFKANDYHDAVMGELK